MPLGGKMLEGYIKLHRQIMEWEWYSDINVTRVFIHCLLKANHKDNKWLGKTIKAGSFTTSYEKLSIETGLSVQNVRTALNKLKSTNEITYQSTSQYSIITINNWYKFQLNNTQINNQITNDQQTINNQLTTNNNDKNDNNEKNVFLLEEKREKKLDPYMNPIKTFFIEECQKQLKKMPRLSSFECNRLIELASENSDIKELIPIAISKLKGIKFDDINFKPSVNWLLKGNNFERVINGEFDGLKKEKENRPEYSTEYKPFILSEEDAKEAEITRLKISEKIKAKRRG